MKPAGSSKTSPAMLAFADKVAELVNDKFHQLTTHMSAAHAARKVLAGVVVSSPGEHGDELTVVCVTTGTKCIGGQYISNQVPYPDKLSFLYSDFNLPWSTFNQEDCGLM